MPSRRDATIDWTLACQGVPSSDLLADLHLPEDAEDAVHHLVTALESRALVLWEAIIRREQGLVLDEHESHLLATLDVQGRVGTLDKVEVEGRIHRLGALARPAAPWHDTLRSIAESLLVDHVDTEVLERVPLWAWSELQEAFEILGDELRLPPDARHALEVVPRRTRARLHLLGALVSLPEMEQGTSSPEREEWRWRRGLEDLLANLQEDLGLVRELGLTVAGVLGSLRLPERQASFIERALLEVLALPATDTPLVEALEQWKPGATTPLGVEEARDLLYEGESLCREDAERIAALGKAVVPLLLDILRDDLGDSDQVWAAAWLAAALGARRALRPLARLLKSEGAFDEFLGDEVLGEAAAGALACMGPSAMEPLVKALLKADSWRMRRSIVEALSALAVDHAEMRPLVAPLLVSTLQDPGAYPGERGRAACLLHDLDWREALPAVIQGLEAGLLRVDRESEVALREWGEGREPVPRPRRAPLDHFLYRHQQAWRQHRESIEDALRTRLAGRDSRWEKDVADLVRDPRRRPWTESPVAARAVAANWPPWGYALLPSQQIALLGAEAVNRHLDLLEMSAEQLAQAMATLDDDYLRWAASWQSSHLDAPEVAACLAVQVALSERLHPAIDYESVLDHTLGASRLPFLPQSERLRLVERALRGGLVERVWKAAAALAAHHPEQALELFDCIRRRRPHDPWTAVAMAEVVGAGAWSALQESLELLRASEASPRCEAWVVRGYLAQHGPRVAAAAPARPRRERRSRSR